MSEIGSCDAILRSIRTNVDGSIKIELELNPTEKDVILKLMELFADNMKHMSVGFVSHGE